MVHTEAESETASDVMSNLGHHQDQRHHHPLHHRQRRPPTRARLEAEKENATPVEDDWTHVKFENKETSEREFGNALNLAPLQNQYSNMPTRSRKDKERKARRELLSCALKSLTQSNAAISQRRLLKSYQHLNDEPSLVLLRTMAAPLHRPSPPD